jgi:group II intron reverse transcriptase/maturase
MKEPPRSEMNISTKLERIAKHAREIQSAGLKTLAHYIDIEWLREAHRRTRKDGAPGIDRQTARQYEQHLDANLESLLDRALSGQYTAPPVRRVHIPKGDGTETRPIGIPTFEDKVLQRAVAMVVEAVYEQSFYDFSYGFRPGRSAHQALEAIQSASVRFAGGWLVEVDIRRFFDTVDHRCMQEILQRRIRDRALLRLIGKWLNAGVLEGRTLSHPDEGTPQGGVISPLLANVYLHEVLDEWFVKQVLPALRGSATLVRYADDFIVLFSSRQDAIRFLAVLPKRFGKYGLSIHPEKTRLLSFRRPDRVGNNSEPSGTFNFLGFTHFWALSRRQKWVVKRRTAKDRFRRALLRFQEWCRRHNHDPLPVQHRAIERRLRGHYAYFGITSNGDSIKRFFREVTRAWRKALARRSQRGLPWKKMLRLLKHYPLPAPRIVHRYGT